MTAESGSAIVTGGSRGIGRAIAEALAKAGFRIDRLPERRTEADALAARLPAAGATPTRSHDGRLPRIPTAGQATSMHSEVWTCSVTRRHRLQMLIGHTDTQHWDGCCGTLTAPFHMVVR